MNYLRPAAIALLSLACFGQAHPLVAATTTPEVSASLAKGAGVLKSPDGKIVVSMFADASGRALYAVTREGVSVVPASPLGLLIGDTETGSGVSGLIVEKTYGTNETYRKRGAHAVATDRSNGAILLIRRDNGAECRVNFRVSDDGFAFRYELPAGAGTVKADRSVFAFAPGSSVWAVGGGEEGVVSMKTLDAGKKAFNGAVYLPLTVKTPEGLYLALMESNRLEFPGFRSAKDLGDGKFAANLAGPYTAPGGSPVVTPWRVVLVTPSLDRLVNSNFADTLADKADPALFPEGSDTAWAKPGRLAWSWMRGNGGKSISLKAQKEWADHGAKLGYEYLLVDEGWSHWDEKGEMSCGNFSKCRETQHGDAHWKPMLELLAHAKSRGIKVWLWHAYDDRFNIPGIKSPEARRAFFKKCHDAGVAGLKIDFFPAPTQEVLHWQIEALRDAAKERLMISFHGCGVPAGESRTFPNEMTREGVRGLEYGGGKNYINDTVCLPFNRMLAGHADFTPFDPGKGGASMAAHIANIALIDSPAMHYIEHPATIAKMGAGMSDLISTIPLTWDETRVLAPSEIGKIAVFARRKGASWWLAVLNGTDARKITVPLDFLPAGARVSSEVKDKEGKDVRAYEYESRELPEASKSSVTLDLKAGGGYLGRFESR